MKMLAGMPLEDFHLVADKVMHVGEDKDRTYHSYHNPLIAVKPAIAVLAKLNIEEGLQMALDINKTRYGKGSFKRKACWSGLSLYGGNAAGALAKLKARYKGNTDFGRHTPKYNAMVKAIEQDKAPKKMISLQEARDAKQAGTAARNNTVSVIVILAVAASVSLIARKVLRHSRNRATG